MARYIDVEPLGDKLKEHIKKTESELMLGALSTFLRLLDITPTADVVPVTRCKDCKRRFQNQHGDAFCINPHGMGDKEYWVNDNWYCHHGERKDDETDRR